MNRVIVFILCLASAGGIAAYAYYFRDASEPAAVYTVSPRAPEAVAKSPAAAPPPQAIDVPGDRASLARALQRELKRVGCYDGEITGVWTTSSRIAMKAFTERVNATLPIDTPDFVLLSLVQGHKDRACGVPCPPGQSTTGSGGCVPNAVLAKAAKTPAPADGKSDVPADRSSALPVAGAATALALAAPAVVPAPDAKAAGPRPAAAVPPPQETLDKKGLGEKTVRHAGPVPPEGVRERRPRRSAASRPPKVVRDVLKVLGFK